jgi:hypothetical protein
MWPAVRLLDMFATVVTSGKPLFDELVLLRCFQRDGVHTVTSADVPSVQPVHLQTARWTVFPTEEVRMRDAPRVSVCGVSNSCKHRQQ